MKHAVALMVAAQLLAPLAVLHAADLEETFTRPDDASKHSCYWYWMFGNIETNALAEPTEDKTVSATPNALVLFNPALVLAPLVGFNFEKGFDRVTEERMGTNPERISPAHHITKNAPPTIIFHGRADTTVPFPTSEAFTTKMKAAGNRCELVGFDGAAHSFYHSEPFFTQTQTAADGFLASLGWLKASPTGIKD